MMKSPNSSADWWRLGVVAVVAVLLSLIGFSVASRFQPSGGTSPPAAIGDDTTSTSMSSTTTAPSVAPPPTGGTTTSAAAAQPATLTLSTDLLDFGEGEDSLSVQVEHQQGDSATWQLAADSPGLSIEPQEGEIADGDSVAVTVTLDRSQVAEGEFGAVLTLSWVDGQSTAEVVAFSEDDPIIHNPKASPSTVQVASGSECSPTQTTISARVRDTSEVDRVIARWSSDGSITRETVMKPVGDDFFEGVIGPYDVVGSDSVKVVAFDVRGNAGGASVSVAVVACG